MKKKEDTPSQADLWAAELDLQFRECVFLTAETTTAQPDRQTDLSEERMRADWDGVPVSLIPKVDGDSHQAFWDTVGIPGASGKPNSML